MFIYQRHWRERALLKRDMKGGMDPLLIAPGAEGSKSQRRAWKRLVWKSLRGICSVKLRIITLEQEETIIPTFRERLCCRWRFSRLVPGAVAPSCPVTLDKSRTASGAGQQGLAHMSSMPAGANSSVCSLLLGISPVISPPARLLGRSWGSKPSAGKWDALQPLIGRSLHYLLTIPHPEEIFRVGAGGLSVAGRGGTQGPAACAGVPGLTPQPRSL